MKKHSPLYHHYRQRLAKASLFKNLSTETLDNMLLNFRFETWTKGAQKNSKLSLQRFYVILEGRMELELIHPETGKCFTTMILKEGDVYDVLSLLDNEEHDVIPVALDNLTLLSAPLESVRGWIQRHPEFNQSLLPYLSKLIRLREEIAADLALRDTSTRLARVILRHIPSDHSDNDREENSRGIKVELLHDLSNEQLAQIIGSVRQVVNHHLTQMKKGGVIHMENNRIIVDDLQQLKLKAEVMHGHLERHLS